MELVIVFVVILFLGSTFGVDQVPVENIPGCTLDEDFENNECGFILGNAMMECGNHLKLRVACCSSKNIPSILQGVEARDAGCVCCKEQTSYKFNHKMFGTVSDPDEPCEGDCYRPMYTKEANLQSCEPDNSDCASLLENKGLTCDNPDKPQLKLEPTCCSENKDNQDVPRGNNKFHCYCCGSEVRTISRSAFRTCNADCLYPFSKQEEFPPMTFQS